MAESQATRPSKRIKLESLSPKVENEEPTLEPEAEVDVDVDEDHCTICLQSIVDRTVIPTCSHEFCFECLMVWSEQSRRCPLCAQNIGDYLIHRIRSTFDYQKHFLPPLRTSPRPLTRINGARIAPVHRRRERTWGPRDRAAQDEADALERAHVASNKYTRYRPYPTPTQFAASQDLISRMTVFLRREFLVWPNADVEFLVTFVISLMKSIDIRSESAIKLLAEFLDMDTPYVPGERHVNAEHFAHEIYCYLRSPYKALSVYDSVVQYDTPPGIPSPTSYERARRWESGPFQSQSQSPDHRRSRSYSHSPPSRRERNARRERSPHSRAVPQERHTSVLVNPENLAEDQCSCRSVQSGWKDKDGCHAQRICSSLPTHNKDKGKQRASSYSRCPKHESGHQGSSVIVPHDRTQTSELSNTPTGFSRSPSPDSGAEKSTIPPGVPHEEPSLLLRSSHENNVERSYVVSPSFRDGSPSAACVTGTADDAPSLFEGSQSLNEAHNTSDSSSRRLELSDPVINEGRTRSNPLRQPRYRNQRDSIIAYLRTRPSPTTPRPLSSTRPQPTPVPSLLSRITDETVVGLGTTPDGDIPITITTNQEGGGDMRTVGQRAERSSRPSANDDLSVRKDTATTRVEHSEPSEALLRSSRAQLLDRLNSEKTAAAEAQLRMQARLRTRLAAERRLAHIEVRVSVRSGHSP
ncbi:hypothetical protein B0F90DRAFT_1722579 [Multifurca ochricompacta]|uniref:RING-type E3 ubiquitin transferase n=1 Tax=Multifurca ochricompacta TaxID=376703 RepID=A0AAD4QNJ1_9AGAM|nr:hypothetical protein B0F90DRAFT_1722579 [Multifurca ochricompacta]